MNRYELVGRSLLFSGKVLLLTLTYAIGVSILTLYCGGFTSLAISRELLFLGVVCFGIVSLFLVSVINGEALGMADWDAFHILLTWQIAAAFGVYSSPNWVQHILMLPTFLCIIALIVELGESIDKDKKELRTLKLNSTSE